MAQVNISSPADLAKAIDGRSDDEINKAMEGQYDKVCRQILEGMRDHFLPDKAAGETVVIQYDVTAPDGLHTFQLNVAGGKCAVVKGVASPPRVALGLAFPDLLRLVSGKLDGMQAFFSGKLKLTGDIMVAQTMQAWFSRS